MQEVGENRMDGEEGPNDGTRTNEAPGADARSTGAQGEVPATPADRSTKTADQICVAILHPERWVHRGDEHVMRC